MLNNDAWKGLAHLAPTAEPRIDYRLEAIAGQPPVLTHWNTDKLGPKPTDAQITTAAAAYDTAQTTKQQEQAAKRQARDILRTRLATLGSGTTALTNQQRDTAIRDIAKMIAEHLTD